MLEDLCQMARKGGLQAPQCTMYPLEDFKTAVCESMKPFSTSKKLLLLNQNWTRQMVAATTGSTFVQAPKWSRPQNDRQTGPKMIAKLDPKWSRPQNDPEVNLGMGAWYPSDCGWTLNFFCHIYFNDWQQKYIITIIININIINDTF